MLVELNIRNFALIDELRLEASPGFGVLTGETGAGKSIIVDAMNAALGGKMGPDVVRTGTQKAVVEAVFDLRDCPRARSIIEEMGFDSDEGLLVAGREISAEGRSQCRINGRPATAGALREVTSLLIDIHGQHEHQSLLAVPTHLEILDAWCGAPARELRTRIADLYSKLAGLQAEQKQLLSDDRERARLVDLYSFQLDEIGRAQLSPGEDEELMQERNRLANAERLHVLAQQALDDLNNDGAAVDCLSSAAIALERLVQVDPSTKEALEQVNSALISAQEGLALIRSFRDNYEADPERLQEVEDRLDLIRRLQRKYGDTVEQVLAYADDIRSRLEAMSDSEQRLAELDSQISEAGEQLDKACDELRSLRRESARAFESEVEKQLSELAMEKSRFEVLIEETAPGPTGADRVEFLVSANPGEPTKPLARVASGGEMSRIMLALKTVMAAADVPTLVFDEIDAGIGGHTAQVLGEKLASLASRCQVMCVTHLPQVASKASWHAAVSKIVQEGRSVVRLRLLDDDERVRELARMMGAGEESSAAVDHAREMLSLANNRAR